MLNKEELKQLRSEIVLNSLYYNDYKNSLGIDKVKTCDFFESYAEHLGELMQENEKPEYNYYDLLSKYDNIENLYNYYMYMFEDDPLMKENKTNEKEK